MFVDLIKLKKGFIYFTTLFFAMASVAAVIYYIVWPSAAYFHADCSDTILWAQASYDSASMFNKDFGYAAMLPFGGTMLMIPFIGIFGVSMTTHHIGMVLFSLLLFASVWMLCKTLKFSTPLSFAAVGTFATVLCASAKLREIFYEHVIYYSICIFIICILLSLFIKFKESFSGAKVSKGFIIIALCTVAFSACSALDGMQVIATGVVPVLFAAVMEIFLNKEQTLLSRESRASVYWCIICGVSVLAGLVMLTMFADGVSAGYAGAYSSYANMNEWLSNLGKFPEFWFSLFGVDAHYGMSIFSLESIINIIRIASAIIIVIVPVIALCLYRKFDFGSRALILTHFGLSAVIMFGFIFGILSAASWRLSPMICTGVLVCFAVFKSAKGYIVPLRLSAVMLCILILMSGVSFMNIAQMETNGIEQNEKYRISQQLKEKGLTYGYATFWNSQAITVLSDSEVRAANVDVNENGIAPCAYQSNQNWFKEQEGIDEYFVLLSYAEEATLMKTEDWVYFDILTTDIVELDGYNAYVFNSTAFLN